MQLQIQTTGIRDGHRVITGFFTVDDVDAWAAKRKWHIDSTGYPCTFTEKGCKRFHRFVLDIPSGMVGDHINRNKMDNTRANLRAVSQHLNVLNSNGPFIANFEAGICSRGHAKTVENMYMRKDRPGKWNCRACRRQRRKEARNALAI